MGFQRWNHVGRTWWPSMMKNSGSVDEEKQMLLIFMLVRFSTLSPVTSSLTNCSSTDYRSGGWGGLRPGWTARPKRLGSAAESPDGVKSLEQYSLTSSSVLWMMGQRTPSANLQMIQNWEEQLVVLPCINTGWRSGTTGTSVSSNGKAKPCIWGGVTPYNTTGCGLNGQKTAL